MRLVNDSLRPGHRVHSRARVGDRDRVTDCAAAVVVVGVAAAAVDDDAADESQLSRMKEVGFSEPSESSSLHKETETVRKKCQSCVM